jgi:hypothetical protein
MSQQDFHYSMNIEWSDKDNVYCPVPGFLNTKTGR